MAQPQQWTQRYRAALIVMCAAILILATMRMTRFLGGTQASANGTHYFYDMDTGDLFVMDAASETPPVVAPSGAEGVLALVYSCGSCDAADERSIEYLRKCTPEAKAMLDDRERGQEITPQTMQTIQTGWLVSADLGKTWVAQNSPTGERIMRRATTSTCPNGSAPKSCRP
jgi:hypothetical protein